MFELMCAVVIGAIFGYISKKGNPTLNIELYNQVEKLNEEIDYYKDLCKWHVEQKDESFEKGRQQGMKQERAMWELSASTQELLDK